MEDIHDKFIKLISTEFKVELLKVTPNAKFKEDFGADSLDLIEFMLVVEREFNIKLENEILQDLTTVGQAFTFLLSKLQT